MPDIVELAPGSERNGLACMIAELLRQTVQDQPYKERLLKSMQGRVAIIARDIPVALTISFSDGCARVYDGIVGEPDIVVRATSDVVTQLSLIETATPLHVPDPRGANTRAIVEATKQGTLEVHGALFNPALLWNLTRLMTVN